MERAGEDETAARKQIECGQYKASCLLAGYLRRRLSFDLTAVQRCSFWLDFCVDN